MGKLKDGDMKKFPSELWYDEDSASPKVYDKKCFGGYLWFWRIATDNVALYHSERCTGTRIVYESRGTLYKYDYYYYTLDGALRAAKDIQIEINLGIR